MSVRWSDAEIRKEIEQTDNPEMARSLQAIIDARS
mgnify:CR=1 FL=1